LYTAHEVLQAKPIFDRGDIYAKFILANSWTSRYLANAYKSASSSVSSSKSPPPPQQPTLSFRAKSRNLFLKFLNSFAFHLQYHYMKSKITHETITLHSAYFHPNDYAARGIIDL
jgi:hypothetical protein